MQGPIWVCTTNDGLDDVLQRLDPPQRNQLIFIQNGMLLPFLEAHQLQRNTQVLLYMSGKQHFMTEADLTKTEAAYATRSPPILHQCAL